MCVKQNCGDFREKSGSFQHMRAFQKQLSAGVGICSLHTSPVEGSLLGLGSGQRDSGQVTKPLLYKSFSTASALPQSKSQTVLCFQSGMRIQNPHLNMINFQDNTWK